MFVLVFYGTSRSVLGDVWEKPGLALLMISSVSSELLFLFSASGPATLACQEMRLSSALYWAWGWRQQPCLGEDSWRESMETAHPELGSVGNAGGQKVTLGDAGVVVVLQTCGNFGQLTGIGFSDLKVWLQVQACSWMWQLGVPSTFKAARSQIGAGNF